MSNESHPMQPIVLGKDGVARFKANAIVELLLETGKFDMNTLAGMKFDYDDLQQLAQLIGYSISGYGELEYSDECVLYDAQDVAEALVPQPAKEEDESLLEDRVKRIEVALKELGYRLTHS